MKRHAAAPAKPTNGARFPLSLRRWWSIVLKEFLQLRRDRVTFGMIVGLPIVQHPRLHHRRTTDRTGP